MKDCLHHSQRYFFPRRARFPHPRNKTIPALIEGNTLSEEEVRNIVENKSTIPPSRQYLEQEVKNILNAYERIANSHIDGNSTELTVDEICDCNRLVLRGLELRDSEMEMAEQLDLLK